MGRTDRTGASLTFPILLSAAVLTIAVHPLAGQSRTALTPPGVLGWGLCDGGIVTPSCRPALERVAASCPDSIHWLVRFDGPARPSRVEWRRCRAELVPGRDTTADGMGPGERRLLLVRAGPAAADSVVLAWDNVEDPGIAFLDVAGPADPDRDGRQEFVIWAAVSGTGAIRAWCVLGRTPGGEFACWPWPDLTALIRGQLRLGESTLKGLVAREPPVAALAAGDSLTLETGIYREGDANCCPSAGAIRIVLRPGRGRMELVRAVRLPPQP